MPMKRLSIPLLLGIFISSCHKSRKELIVGKWNETFNTVLDTSKQWNYYKDGTCEITDYKKDTLYKFRYELINKDSAIEFFYPDTISYGIIKLTNNILVTEHYGLLFKFTRK